jgi:hypothetical protein
MNVIAHQYVGMQCDLMLHAAVQQVQKQPTVDIANEDRPCSHPRWVTWYGCSANISVLSRHGSSGLQEFIRLPPP